MVLSLNSAYGRRAFILQGLRREFTLPFLTRNAGWILENTNREKGEIFEAPAEQESEWNSDDDEDRDGNVVHYQHFGILGFHPQ